MRPAVPAVGSPLLASWAGDVIDYAGSRWRYVPLEPTGVIARTYPNGVTVNLELTELPANDPTVVAALVHVMVREASAASRVLGVYDGRNTTVRVGFVGATGYASRGSGGTGFIVPVGGTNGRSIGLNGSASATATCWVTVLGYYREESDEPVAGASGTITASPPTNPASGDAALASWANSLLGMVGKGWRYHFLGENNGTSRPTAGTFTEAVPAVIPASAVAASAFLRLRCLADGDSNVVTLYDSSGHVAGFVYSSGVAATYAVTGHYPVVLDATRQYTLVTSAATQESLAVFTGYWTKDA